MKLWKDAGSALQKLRSKRPLIHHITNFVTMTDCANATLAVGASPTMTNAVEEVEEMAAAADALLLNMGTLQHWTVDAILLAGKAAEKAGIPIILDPVGAGGTAYRTESVLRVIQNIPVTIIRGNLSEIICLAYKKSGVNPGVDNHEKTTVDISLITRIAQLLGTTVVITGAADAVSDGTHSVVLGNGCPMLTYVTGTGCMTTSLIASFAAVTDPFTAAAAGTSVMAIAGEQALADGGNAGPGSFHQLLFNSIYQFKADSFNLYGKVLIENGTK